MAILFDNKYHRITKNVANYDNNTTEIEMQVYASTETREREKKYKNQAKTFIKKVQQFLVDNMNNLIKEINLMQPIDSIADRETFLSNHPTIKQRTEDVEAMQKEGLHLIDSVFRKNIDVSKLKYVAKWRDLGLTDDLCYPIELLGTMQIAVDGIKDNNLSILYPAVKEKIVSQVVDC